MVTGFYGPRLLTSILITLYLRSMCEAIPARPSIASASGAGIVDVSDLIIDLIRIAMPFL